MAGRCAMLAAKVTILMFFLLCLMQIPSGAWCVGTGDSGSSGAARHGSNPSSSDGEDAAEEPEDSKLNTEDATPVDPGTWELQFLASGLTARQEWSGSGVREKRAYMRTLVAAFEACYGVREGLDVAVGTGYLDLLDKAALPGPTTGSGIGDSYVLAKTLVSGESRTHIALLTGVSIPTGSGDSNSGLGTGAGYWSFTPELSVTRAWGDWTSNAALVGAVPIGDSRGTARGSLEVDLAIGRQVREWLQPEAEVNYLHDFTGGGSDCLAVTAGLVLPISEHLRVDLGGQQMVVGKDADQTTSWVVTLVPALGPVK